MALTKDQIANRKIGGSSAAAILGISKYRTRYQEWLRLTGQEEPEDLSENIHIHTGNLLEPIIVQMLHERGFEFKSDMEQEIHPNIPYISRTLDGIENGNIIHEIKTADSWMMNQNWPIPTYEAQINHYALWPGTEKMYLHVLFVPTELKQILFDVEFSDEQLFNMCQALELRTIECEPDILKQEYMLEKYAEFWDYVERKEQPPAQNMAELANMFMLSESGTVPATDEILRADTRMREIKVEIKSLESEYEENKFLICDHMKENDTLIYNQKKIRTWKSNKNGVRVFR